MLESTKNIGKQIASTFKVIGYTFNILIKEADLNITIEQFIIMSAIEQNKNITQNEIAIMYNKDKSNILRQIESLKNKQFVERISDEADKRKKILLLTDYGKENLNKMKEIEMRTYEKLLKNIPKHNLNILSETFEIIQKSAS